MKYIFVFIFILFPSCVFGEEEENENTIRIAVIDTGFDFESNWEKYINKRKDGNGLFIKKPKLCKEGHKNFTQNGLHDNNGHGTHIAGIIAKHAQDSNYCLIIVKYYDPLDKKSSNVHNTYKSFEYALKQNVDIINYSSGGGYFSYKEYTVVKKILNKGIVMVVAAGNEGQTVDYNVLKAEPEKEKITYIHRGTNKITNEAPTMYYPAAYDARIISVKNISKSGVLAITSNRGLSFTHKEMGKNILSIYPNNSIRYMTGTSQSAAVRTGKIIKQWNKK